MQQSRCHPPAPRPERGASQEFPGLGIVQGGPLRCSSPPLRAPLSVPARCQPRGQRPRCDVCLDALACFQIRGRDQSGLGLVPHTDCGYVSVARTSQLIPRADGAASGSQTSGMAVGASLATGPFLIIRAAILDEEGYALRYGTQHYLDL